MKYTILALLMLFVAAGAMAAPDPPNIYVKVSVKAEGESGGPSGSGGFTVPDNEYGRITMAFYDDGQSFRIRASGSKVGPVLHTLKQGDHTTHTGDLGMTNDLYLKPHLNEFGEIEVTGYLIRMTRMTRVDSDEPLYEYSEEKLKFILPNGGSMHLNRRQVSPWKNIELEISAYTSEPLAHQSRTERYVSIDTEYSLYNERAGKFELKASPCGLGISADGAASVGSCWHHKTFYLESGDSLMLMTSYSIGNVQWRDDNTLRFYFDMSRYYALNPFEADTVFRHGASLISLGDHGLAADKITIREFHREITVRAGEKTEIEIPSDSDNPLPFGFTERIILTNEVETKSY